VRGIDFSIGAGEIVGLTGLIGSGFEEVPYLLAGARRAGGGTLAIGERRVQLGRRPSIARLIAAGVALVPERRAEEGLALDMSVLDNLTLPRVSTRGSRLWTGRDWQRREVDEMVGRLDIRPPRPDAVVGTLSGGNQQKVLLGKWLVGRPRLLLLHEPTQAVDVSARAGLIDAVREAADSGCAVIVAGSDPQELGALCDRVLVLRDGAIDRELAEDLDEDTIIHATFGDARAAAQGSPTSS
jgi:ribose transport system ATP-binding protein